MDVSGDLKEMLKEAVLVAHEVYGGDEELLDRIVEAVEDVLISIPVEKEVVSDQVAVKYVGKRQVYSDGLFNTGFWETGQTKMVTESTASKMFAHPDVYISGEQEESSGSVESSLERKINDDDETLQDARDAVMAMTRKEAVRQFIADNYNGMQIPAEHTKLDAMKMFAIQQIDLFRLP